MWGDIPRARRLMLEKKRRRMCRWFSRDLEAARFKCSYEWVSPRARNNLESLCSTMWCCAEPSVHWQWKTKGHISWFRCVCTTEEERSFGCKHSRQERKRQNSFSNSFELWCIFIAGSISFLTSLSLLVLFFYHSLLRAQGLLLKLLSKKYLRYYIKVFIGSIFQ